MAEVCYLVHLEARHPCPSLYVDESPRDAFRSAEEQWPLVTSFPGIAHLPARIVIGETLLDRLPPDDAKGRLQLQSLLAREAWRLTHPTKPRHRPLWMTAAAWLSQALAVHRLETHFQDLRETFNTPEAQRPAWLWDRNTGNPLLEYGKAMHLAWKKQQVRDKRGSAERAMAKAAAIGITARLAIRGVDRIWTSNRHAMGLLTAERMAVLVAGDPILAIRAAAAAADPLVMPEHARASAPLAGTVATLTPEDRALVQWAHDPASQPLFAAMEGRRADYARLTAPPPWAPSAPLLGGAVLCGMLLVVVGCARGRAVKAMLLVSLCISGSMLVLLLRVMVGSALCVDLYPADVVLWLPGVVLYIAIMAEAWWLNVFSVEKAWRQYVELLTTRWVEQSEVTVGLWQQCRGLNKMAKQSLHQINQELKGSWQNSLLEIAMKMADLKQQVSPAQCGMMDIHPAKAQDLWLGVDRRLQAAFRNEVTRMEHARSTDDQKVLEKLASWWMEEISTWRSYPVPTSDLVASFRGSSLASDGELEPYLERTTCLANLQHQPKKLHSMYPYDDFFDRGDLSEGDEDSLGSSSPRLAELMESPEARRRARDRLKTLEDRLKRHHHRLESLQQHIPRRCNPPPALQFWKEQLVGLVHQEDPVPVREWFAKWRVAFVLLFAAAASGLLAWRHAEPPALPPDQQAAHLLAFAAASASALCHIFLLYHYGHLNLRHKHQRFEQLLEAANKERVEIEREMRASEVLGSSPKIRALHLKAQIYTQSVNVVRNVNYLTLCIKNEMQRHTNSIARSKVVIFGLSLLDAVFCDTDVTEPVMDAIRGLCQRPGTGLLQLPVATQSDIRRMISDCTRRKNMLLSMYHLHCEVPPEWQGSLEHFAMHYLRPILVDRCMPRHTDKHLARKMLEPALEGGRIKLSF
eukprot:EG_transcript_1366